MTATLVTAVFSFGLPTETQRLYAVGLCRIKGEDNCEELSGDENGPDSEAGGDGGGGGTDDPGSGDGESPAPEESGSPSPGGEGGDGGEGSEESGWDPALAEALYNAENDLEAAEQDLDKAGVENTWKDLLGLVGSIIGYDDAKACLTEGDLVACLWTVVGISPFGKGAKLVTKLPEITKLWNRWRKAKKLEKTRKAKLAEAQQKYDDAFEACEGLADTAAEGAMNDRTSPDAGADAGRAVIVPAFAGPGDVPGPPGSAPGLPSGGVLVEAGSSVPAGKNDKKKPPACSFVPAPGSLSAFPGAKKAKSKTSVQGGGKKRARWKDDKGNIYEWDYQHGTVEKYNKRGKHMGEYDPDTGEQTKPADPKRTVEP
ncbi:colicin E3/pyocin S6 family cytotoxin [Nocardiopsis composta]|uniref:Colicin E3-like ribonuclease domain-containing protein n=1 Tax=Nocardiopsis composta TaxID=157465 RepID=A0A7W8QR90_9ACTN|nr:colicin E3/pyocin S6 family cytotoxin [Nocardiopsis composta]MBB5435148.1 hypothetical protein [Nocardiopsis composta]